MRRNNFWIISLATAVVTVVSLNLAVGRSSFRNSFDRGYWHHYNHHHHCNGFDDENSNNGRGPNEKRPDSLNY